MIPLKRKGHTSVRQERLDTVVKLYDTDIVRSNSDYVTFNTGGWRTVTTRQRMNQAAQELGLCVYVFQKNFEWYVATDNHKLIAKFGSSNYITFDRKSCFFFI